MPVAKGPEVTAADSVALVVGCGPVGLAVIAALKAAGHGPVIAADFSPRRRAAAERLGADIVIDPAKESPHDRWEALGVPKARGAQQMMRMMGKSFGRPVVFECVGAPGVVQALIEAAPAGAQIVVAGVCMETDRIEPSIAITKEIELTFVFGYSPEEFAATLGNIAEGRIDVSGLVTGKVGLDGVAKAFTDLGDPEAHVKILVEPASRRRAERLGRRSHRPPPRAIAPGTSRSLLLTADEPATSRPRRCRKLRILKPNSEGKPS